MILSNPRLYLCMVWLTTNFSFLQRRPILFCSFTRMALNAQMTLLIFLILFGVLFSQLKTWLQEVWAALFHQTKKIYKNTASTASCFQSEETSKRSKCRQKISDTSTCFSFGTVRIQEHRWKPKRWRKGMLLTTTCNKLKIQVWMSFSQEEWSRTRNFREVTFLNLRMWLTKRSSNRGKTNLNRCLKTPMSQATNKLLKPTKLYTYWSGFFQRLQSKSTESTCMRSLIKDSRTSSFLKKKRSSPTGIDSKWLMMSTLRTKKCKI